MQKELEDKITIAICNWLNKKEQQQSIGDIDYLVENIQNYTSNKGTVKRIFELAHSIEDEVLRFFEAIYDKDSDEINIDSKKESDLDRTVVWNILEKYLEAINIKNDKITLDSGIDELFSKYSSYTDKGLTILLKNAKQYRNSVHKGHRTKEALAEVWKQQAIGLYIIAFVFKAPKTSEKKAVNKKKEESDFLSILSSWYKNNINRFNGLPHNYVENYLNDHNTVILRILEIINEDIQLKEALGQILQLADMNGEVKESESVNLHLSLSTFLEKYLMQANLMIYKDAYTEIGNDISWERDIELLKKLCSHIEYYDTILFDRISLDHEKSVSYNNTTQISENCANYINNHFFRLLFIIGSLKIAIERNKTGVLYYANNDIEVLPYKNAKRRICVRKEVPCYYHQDRLFERTRRKTIDDEINAFRGDFSLDNVSNRKISLSKNKWTIVILDFPPRKEGQIKDIITNVKFPGLIDLASKGNEAELQNQESTKSTQKPKEKQKESPNGTLQQFLPPLSSEEIRRGLTPSTNVRTDSHNSENGVKNEVKIEEKKNSIPQSLIVKNGNTITPVMDILKGLYPHKDEKTIENAENIQEEYGAYKNIDNSNKEEHKEKIWDVVSTYTGGFGIIKDKDGKYGIINQLGKVVVPCKWTDIKSFEDGLACVKDDTGNWGFINERGEIAISCTWRNVHSFGKGTPKGFAFVQDEKEKWGFINKSGELIFPCALDEDYLWFKQLEVFDNNGIYYKICEDGTIIKKDSFWLRFYNNHEDAVIAILSISLALPLIAIIMYLIS